MEKWYTIKGYAGVYWVSDLGRVRNAEGHILKQIPSKGGNRVELRYNGQRETPFVKDLLKGVEENEVFE